MILLNYGSTINLRRFTNKNNYSAVRKQNWDKISENSPQKSFERFISRVSKCSEIFDGIKDWREKKKRKKCSVFKSTNVKLACTFLDKFDKYSDNRIFHFIGNFLLHLMQQSCSQIMVSRSSCRYYFLSSGCVNVNAGNRENWWPANGLNQA